MDDEVAEGVSGLHLHHLRPWEEVVATGWVVVHQEMEEGQEELVTSERRPLHRGRPASELPRWSSC